MSTFRKFLRLNRMEPNSHVVNKQTNKNRSHSERRTRHTHTHKVADRLPWAASALSELHHATLGPAALVFTARLAERFTCLAARGTAGSLLKGAPSPACVVWHAHMGH